MICCIIHEKKCLETILNESINLKKSVRIRIRNFAITDNDFVIPALIAILHMKIKMPSFPSINNLYFCINEDDQLPIVSD